MKPVENLPRPATRIVVVGGCGGMGRALVRAALDSQMRVAVLDLARSIEQTPPPPEVLALPCDLSAEDSVVAAFDRIAAHWGGMDCLVNLAGFTGERVYVKDLSTRDWDEITDCCVRGHFLAARSAIPLLKKGNDPSMVLVASTFGHQVALPGCAAYAASKAGVVSLGKALALECGPAIRVNVVSPGVFRTPFLDGGTGRDRRAKDFDFEPWAKTLPLRRLGDPEEIVGPILFLASPAASYITGQVLHVNGGSWAP